MLAKKLGINSHRPSRMDVIVRPLICTLTPMLLSANRRNIGAVFKVDRWNVTCDECRWSFESSLGIDYTFKLHRKVKKNLDFFLSTFSQNVPSVPFCQSPSLDIENSLLSYVRSKTCRIKNTFLQSSPKIWGTSELHDCGRSYRIYRI